MIQIYNCDHLWSTLFTESEDNVVIYIKLSLSLNPNSERSCVAYCQVKHLKLPFDRKVMPHFDIDLWNCEQDILLLKFCFKHLPGRSFRFSLRVMSLIKFGGQ